MSRSYFSQHVNVPAIEENAGGPAYLNGTFDVGEGKYHVDWLMRDRAERICSSNWEIEASPAGERQADGARYRARRRCSRSKASRSSRSLR